MKRQDAMTTVHTMLAHIVRTRAPRGATIAALATIAVAIAGCAASDPLEPPHVLVAPYSAANGDALWAVAPLANESGISIVDTLAISDAIAERVTETRGVSAIPINRTIAAMRSLGLDAVEEPAQAIALANALGADGIIVGSVTAYDPYDPPTLGLTLVLHTRNRIDGNAYSSGFDPRVLEKRYTDYGVAYGTTGGRPDSTVSLMLNGADHEVLMNVRRFAQGRHDPTSALGWRRYLASMELYTDFATYAAVRGLLDKERLRVARNVREQQPAG